MKNEDQKLIVSEKPNDETVIDFIELVGCIMEYYNDPKLGLEEGEQWKQGTDYDTKNIPENVSKAIQVAFLSQLNKFIKRP